MRTEEDDPMVWESRLPYPKDLDRSVLAARAREMQEAVSKTGVFEISVFDSPASGDTQVTDQVVGMESLPPSLTHSPVGDDMSKHGDGAQTESAQEQELALPTKPSEGGIASELPLESSSFPSRDSGDFNDIAGKGTAVAQKTRTNRGKNWREKETDDLLGAFLNTPKVCSRMEQGTDSDPYWDAVAKAVPGRTGLECRGRMDTLKRLFSTLKKKHCDGEGKEFKQPNEEGFGKMKKSPRLTEAWYNLIRDHCPPRPKKKLKTNGAGSSSKSTGFVPDTSTSGLLPPVLGEPAMVASGPVTQPMEDPPACQVADPLHQVPQNAAVAEGFIEDLVTDPLHQQQAPPGPQNADVAEDCIYIDDLLANFDLGTIPPWV